MTPELIAIISASIALAGLILASNRQLSGRIERVEASIVELHGQVAHQGGFLEGLRNAIVRDHAT